MHIESWNLYFPEEQYTVYNEAIDIIKKFKECLKIDNLNLIERDRIFNLDYEAFKNLTFNFKDKNHEIIIDCLSCAVSEILKENGFDLVKIRTRLMNWVDLNVNFTPDNCGALMFLVGTACRIGFKKIILLKAFFECSKCHEILSVSVLDNIYTPPKKCLGSCKSRTFTFLFHHSSTIMRDVQEIKVQKINDNINEGDKNIVIDDSLIDCLIYDEYVGTISPGDVLRICGVICSENINNNRKICNTNNASSTNNPSSLYKLVLRVNNLEHLNSRNLLIKDSPLQNDFDLFKKISKTPNIIPTLINSIYPEIFGHDLIKVGLLLSLFGGTKKFVGHSVIRSEIHTLIVGDPGLGKSRMLLSSCFLPKSLYISGNLTTTAGLTVSLTHDPTTGDFMADAGALVIADNGVCCMDEFDKIDDHSALFEAMEEQKVTVAKGGVVCSIPTHTTIIAASNPKYGHFDKSKSIRENLRFDSALLSRFDLIFILVDDLNEKENYEISGQILKKRKGERNYSCNDGINSGISRISSGIFNSNDINNSTTDILNTLRSDPFINNNTNTPLIPLDNIRKYINYARNTVFPVISITAKEEIKKFYLEIRTKRNITTRDLESLIRLTESRAKIELRSIATKEDAIYAIGLYKRIMKKENQKKKKTLKEFENELKKRVGEIITKTEIEELIKEYEMSKGVEEIIETLNYKGVIIKKGVQEYKVV